MILAVSETQERLEGTPSSIIEHILESRGGTRVRTNRGLSQYRLVQLRVQLCNININQFDGARPFIERNATINMEPSQDNKNTKMLLSHLPLNDMRFGGGLSADARRKRNTADSGYGSEQPLDRRWSQEFAHEVSFHLCI